MADKYRIPIVLCDLEGKTRKQAAQELGVPEGTVAGRLVRVTAPVDIGVLGLADLVSEFVREYPDIHVDLSLSSKVVDLVEEGFDIGVRAGKSRDASLVARRLGAEMQGEFDIFGHIADVWVTRRGAWTAERKS